MKTKRTSLDDIAKSVGVSKATVSFVLNGKGDEFNISKEKQKIIREKAKEMSYVPNFFAKSLRQGETKTIGVVLSDISNPFYAELCKTIQVELYSKGYNVFIVNTNEDQDLETKLMQDLIQRSIDGMIISPTNAIEPLIPILLATHIPVVFTDRPGDENADFVGIDNEREAQLLVKQFSKKPKKLAIVTDSNKDVITIQNRLKGAESAAKAEKIAYEIVNFGSDAKKNYKALQALLKGGVDSFLTLNNVAALKTIAAIQAEKLVMPKDVRLISFDDSDVFQYVTPPISALSQPIAAIGSKTVDRLMARLKESKNPGEHFLLHCEFLARGSH